MGMGRKTPLVVGLPQPGVLLTSDIAGTPPRREPYYNNILVAEDHEVVTTKI